MLNNLAKMIFRWLQWLANQRKVGLCGGWYLKVKVVLDKKKIPIQFLCISKTNTHIV